MLRQGFQTGVIELEPPLDDAFDLLHVSDAARTVRSAIEAEQSGLWNVGNGDLTTIHELAEACATHSGSRVNASDQNADRPARVLNWVDDRKARTDLGHVDQIPLDTGIAEIARSVGRDFPTGNDAIRRTE